MTSQHNFSTDYDTPYPNQTLSLCRQQRIVRQVREMRKLQARLLKTELTAYQRHLIRKCNHLRLDILASVTFPEGEESLMEEKECQHEGEPMIV